jgi:glutamyl-Q tRNA(Asp) synthetase
MTAYVGRFAPSPTGALHAGSLVAALASWLDARAQGGKWLVRIEDVDTPRCLHGADLEILRQLAVCGLLPDEAPIYQSQRRSLYQAALDQLQSQGAAYPCACSRKDIAEAQNALGWLKPRHGELIYPGTCRDGLHDKPARAWRFHTDFFKPNRPLPVIKHAQSAINLVVTNLSSTQQQDNHIVHWSDRRLGLQQQNVAAEVGDFVLLRADGLWAYQLAVVVDDAAQGISHIVRGQDLADNTARQILLQRALNVTTPMYLHTPLALAEDGQKLSKQNGAQPLALRSVSDAEQALQAAAHQLGLSLPGMSDVGNILQTCVTQWTTRF